MIVEAERWRQIEPIVDEVLETSPEDRSARLSRLCAGDTRLRAEVEALLDAERNAGAWLERPAEDVAPELVALATERRAEGSRDGGMAIGPYRLLREIGRGGMGTVHLAERADGSFEQLVALKLLRERHAGASLVRRFLNERQILARLQHPGIVGLLDGGVAANGEPYFAMEFVAGAIPIHTYCERHGLDLSRRIDLFEQTCEAVLFAHRHLVVHRDLKPSNVMVDSEGRVRLLDFGIAKLLPDGSDDAVDPQTHIDGVAVTPEYAAPEQLLGGSISTATDVYALGVLLYEMLTGVRPRQFAARTLSDYQKAFDGAPPEPPSKMLARRAASTTSPQGHAEHHAAQQRARGMAGDLDNIVLKALRESPEDRYATVEALLADIECWWKALPVAASRNTMRYRAGRFLRRHRIAVVSTAAAIALVIAGFSATLWQANRAMHEANRAREVTDFVLGLFANASPDRAHGETVTAKELLSRGVQQVERDLKDQPATRGEVLFVVGRVQRELGLYQDALRTLDRARASLAASKPGDDAAIAAVTVELGDVHHRVGDFDQAEALYKEALAVQDRELGSTSPAAARTRSYVGMLALDRGQLDHALPLLRAARAVQEKRLGRGAAETVDTVNAEARVLFAMGRFEESAVLLQEVLNARRRLYGDTHTAVSEAVGNLASARDAMGDPRGAADLYRQALSINRRLLGENHPELSIGWNNLALVLMKQGQAEEAEEAARRALALRQAAVGADNPQMAVFHHNLAKVFLFRGRPEEAEGESRRALALATAALGADHENTAGVAVVLAEILIEQKRLPDAQSLAAKALGTLTSRLDANDPRLADALRVSARTLRESGDPVAAEAQVTRAHLALSARFGRADVRTINCAIERGACLLAMGKHAEGTVLLEESEAALRKLGRSDADPWIRRARAHLATTGLQSQPDSR
jgi:serine/threonine-protein kinase